MRGRVLSRTPVYLPCTTLCPRCQRSWSAASRAALRPCSPLFLPPHPVRSFWNGFVDRLKASNDRGLQKKQEGRDAIRDELRSLSVRQLQILMMDRKPPDLATPLHLTDAASSPVFLPPSTPCESINLLREAVVFPERFYGRLTLLHVGYNAHAFQLGQKWIDAAQATTWPPAPPPPADIAGGLSATTAVPPHTAVASPSPPAFTPPPAPAPTVISPLPPSSSSSSSSSESVPPLQCFQMSLIKNSLVRRWFGPQTLNSLSSSTPPHLHPFLLSVLDDASMAALEGREAVLGLSKQEMLGYVFLVDGEGRLRWRAWGDLLGDDGATVRRMVHELREERRVAERRAEKEQTKARKVEQKTEAGGRYDWREKAAAQQPSTGQHGWRPQPSSSVAEPGRVDKGNRGMGTKHAMLITAPRV